MNLKPKNMKPIINYKVNVEILESSIEGKPVSTVLLVDRTNDPNKPRFSTDGADHENEIYGATIIEMF